MNRGATDREWVDRQFAPDERLGIAVPRLRTAWESLDAARQAAVLARWEEIRGRIPDLVLGLERRINAMQSRLFEEDDFEASCLLNGEIAELASRINDLHIWYRTQQDVDAPARVHG